MKLLKISVIVVLVLGLVAGIVPTLAASQGNDSETANLATGANITDDSLLYGEEYEDLPGTTDILEGMLEYESVDGITELSAEPILISRFVLHTGVVTNVIKDDGGRIIRLTILDRRAKLLTFRIITKTRFYYEEGIPQVVEEGSLVTIVCRPILVAEPQPLEQAAELQATSLPRWRIALAVVVHAPRPSIVYGTVSGINLENKTLNIETKEENVTVKVNNDTKYIFLPRPWNVLLEDDAYQLEPDAKIPGLEDIVVGDRVVVFAPKEEGGIRLARIVVVLPRPHLELISGIITAISEDNHTITLNITEDDPVSSENITFRYTSDTVFVLRGFIKVEVGQSASAWCEKNTAGDLIARLVWVKLA